MLILRCDSCHVEKIYPQGAVVGKCDCGFGQYTMFTTPDPFVLSESDRRLLRTLRIAADDPVADEWGV